MSLLHTAPPTEVYKRSLNSCSKSESWLGDLCSNSVGRRSSAVLCPPLLSLRAVETHSPPAAVACQSESCLGHFHQNLSPVGPTVGWHPICFVLPPSVPSRISDVFCHPHKGPCQTVSYGCYTHYKHCYTEARSWGNMYVKIHVFAVLLCL